MEFHKHEKTSELEGQTGKIGHLAKEKVYPEMIGV